MAMAAERLHVPCPKPPRGRSAIAVGDIVDFATYLNRRRPSSDGVALDRARRDWGLLSGYNREAAGMAMTEFYRLWFAGAERDGYFEQTKPADSE
jgi:hypothetical protein